MTFRKILDKFLLQEDLNFLLTNRIPRRWATQLMGWFSQLKNPLIKSISIATWKMCANVDFSDAAKSHFDSLHDAFIRALKPGARPIDQDTQVVVSPCDGIVGAHGRIHETQVFQAKGFPYSISDLLPTPELAEEFAQGSYITLRITAGMYHRFHAPYDCHISKVTYISGDTWNVNPIALKRVQNLFCKNERAVIESTLALPNAQPLRCLMVPVAAILVASIRLHCLKEPLNLRYRGANIIPCNTRFRKGDELGWFEHGSTIILLLPKGVTFAPGIHEGTPISLGQPLIQLEPNAI